MSVILNTSLDDEGVVAGHVHPAWAGNLSQEKVYEALKAHDIPENVWPKPPNDHKCLQRALDQLRRRGKDRIEALPGKGWALTVVDPEKLDLENPENDGKGAHTVTFTAKVISEGDSTYVRVTPSDRPDIAAFVRGQFEYERTRFSCAKDFSPWFSNTIIPWCQGVAARARGGSWFVPQGEALNRLRRVQAALNSVSEYTWRSVSLRSGEAIEIPSVHVGGLITIEPRMAELGAIQTLLGNLIEDTDGVCDDIHANLTSGNVGRRSLNAQRKKAWELEGKLQQYSDSLGVDLKDLTARLEEIKCAIGMAEAALG